MAISLGGPSMEKGVSMVVFLSKQVENAVAFWGSRVHLLVREF
ncbi:hypothetical protein N9M41_03920 [Rhodopirellula sp.]|nr:hypothetical protein [Rhodopirellula sp.]